MEKWLDKLVLLAVVAIAAALLVALVASVWHARNVPTLREECEARGGMLLELPGLRTACVGKPSRKAT